MKELLSLRRELAAGKLDARLSALCGGNLASVSEKRLRLAALTERFASTFGENRLVRLFSSAGRTELGGNHTDHQRGRVLAGAVDLDMLACAGPNETAYARILSKGFPEISIDLSALGPHPEEEGTSAALVRGIASRFQAMGCPIGGFDVCMDSTVLGGSGLSSSAAYEILIGMILNHLFCDGKIGMIQIAQIGQFAENHFFGKPCGLMDQLASAVGGIISIDFQNPQTPEVRKIEYQLDASGYTLCIIDSGADHADLTEEYAAIPREMRAVAACFGKTVLREVDPVLFQSQIARVRQQTGDRAVLRAMHFFQDNDLAAKQAQALENDDFLRFLSLVNASGVSSGLLLQNLYCASRPQEQSVGIAIAVARHLLAGDGAVRIHGGGFAGTIQAYVPSNRTQAFREGMEAVLGKGCCHFLHIRPEGGAVVA